MHQKETSIALTDRECDAVRKVAEERGISLDAAASELFQEAMAQRFRRGLGRGPAKVFTTPKRIH